VYLKPQKFISTITIVSRTLTSIALPPLTPHLWGFVPFEKMLKETSMRIIYPPLHREWRTFMRPGFFRASSLMEKL